MLVFGPCLLLVGTLTTVGAQPLRSMVDVQPLEEPKTAPPNDRDRIRNTRRQGQEEDAGNRWREVVPGPPSGNKVAILQALDKITARVSKIEAPIGRPVRFGTLDIIVHSCEKRPPEEPPEINVFIEITEFQPDIEPATLFVGWMFASSPALSALEHPVYDVWVYDCLDKSTGPRD